MATSLKVILDAVLGESGFLIPASYSSSQNPDDLQLIALANAAGDEIREAGYQQSIRTGTITLTTATDYALPTDFHSYVSDSLRVVGRLELVELPTDPATWATFKSSGTLPGDTLYCRIINDRLEVLNPTSGEQIRFEYVSNSPWTAGDGVTAKETATLDTDLWQLDRRLLVMATKWRWKKEKGLPDYAEDFQMFQRYANSVRGRHAGAKTITFSASDRLPPEPYTSLWV